MWGLLRQHLRRGHVLVRLAMCAVAAIALWGVTRVGRRRRSFIWATFPSATLRRACSFDQLDLQATEDARKQARKLAVAIYEQDPQPLEQLQAKLVNDVSQLVATDDLKTVSAIWDEFHLPLAEGTPEPTAEERQQQFAKSAKHFPGKVRSILSRRRWSKSSSRSSKTASSTRSPEISTPTHKDCRSTQGAEGFEPEVAVSDVLMESAASQLQKSLEKKLPSLEVSGRVFAWVRRSCR